MKRHMSLISLVILLLATAVLGFGQAGCEFNIAGDWEATVPGQAASNLYRFSSDGTVTVFSSAVKGQEPQKLGRAAYRLDGRQSSRMLEFRPIPGAGIFPWGSTKMEITRT